MLFRSLYGLTFLFLTKSRSSMIGVAVGLLSYFLLTKSLRAKAWAVSALLISAILLYMSGTMESLIAILSRNGEGAGDFTGRVPIWDLALTYVKQRPLTGYGFQNFWTSRTIDYFSSEFHWTISAAHSGYIETLLTLGCVGLCLHVLVLIFGIFRSIVLFKMSRSPIFALAAAICVVVMVVGAVEVVVLWLISPYSFGIILLLWSLFLERSDPVSSGTSTPALMQRFRSGPWQRGAV